MGTHSGAFSNEGLSESIPHKMRSYRGWKKNDTVHDLRGYATSEIKLQHASRNSDASITKTRWTADV